MKYLWLLLILPLVTAINCSQVDDNYLSQCEYVLDSGLSLKEKEYLINDLIDYPEYLTKEEKLKPLVDFTVTTNKKVYLVGEMIEVNVLPQNRNYLLEYAGKKYWTTNKFPAENDNNKIKISFGDKIIYYIIHIKNQKIHDLILTILGFLLISYILFCLIKYCAISENSF